MENKKFKKGINKQEKIVKEINWEKIRNRHKEHKKNKN
jgi:hypothetical protein